MRRWRDELQAGARQRAHVDAAVVVEALVLERHEHGEVARIDVAGFDGKTPAAVRRREGAQQAVVAVEDRVETFCVVSRSGGPSRSMAT